MAKLAKIVKWLYKNTLSAINFSSLYISIFLIIVLLDKKNTNLFTSIIITLLFNSRFTKLGHYCDYY